MKMADFMVHTDFTYHDDPLPGHAGILDPEGNVKESYGVFAVMHLHIGGDCMGYFTIGEPCRDRDVAARYVAHICALIFDHPPTHAQAEWVATNGEKLN